MSEIDFWAYRTPLRSWPWWEKAALGGALFSLAFRTQSPLGHLVLLLLAAAGACGAGRIPLGLWLRLFWGPAGFLLVSASTSALTHDPSAALLSLTRSWACLGGLLWLSLSTPVADWLGILRRSGCPLALAEIGLWMYRLLAAAHESWQQVRTAQVLRAGRNPLQVMAVSLERFGRRLTARTRAWRDTLELRGGSRGLLLPPPPAVVRPWRTLQSLLLCLALAALLP